MIKEQEKTWKTALSSVKGVYVITDTSNGKLYIGSAYSVESIWHRWSEYTKNGHGGNKQLKALIEQN
ncbi:GIY-YIG nuclease family protein, partial [Arthrospira platensis SPKY2]